MFRNHWTLIPLTLAAPMLLASCDPTGPTEAAVATVEVTPAGASISGVGATQTFTAEALDANGNVVPALPVTWTSLNANVATIDVGGTATAVESGQVTIAADVDGALGHALLTVSVPGVATATSWTFDILPAWHLSGVWGASSSDVYAVSVWGTIHYDGTGWSAMASGTSEMLSGVWGTSSSDVYVVGWWGTILHYDGTGWSAMASGTSEWLSGVWGTSSSDVYAVGESGTILHYDGTGWSAMASGTSEGLRGVWGTSSSDLYAVGSHGVILRGSR